MSFGTISYNEFMSEHTFLSYSRHEYYFAESVTLGLQHRGLSVWFDLQQIEPGVNWKADIEDGLARSQSLTLIASRASLASPYVAQEWQVALDTNKPIYIALFERVRLPRELRRRAIILDFRADFEQGVDDLAALLVGGTLSRHRVWIWLPRLPRGVRRVALALALLDLQIFAANALLFVLLVMALYPGSIVRLLAEHFFSRSVDIARVTDLVIAMAAIFLVIRYSLRVRDRVQVIFFLRRDFHYLVIANPASPPLGMRFMIFLLAVLGLSYYLWTTPQFLRRLGIVQSLPGAYRLEVLVALLAAVGAIRLIVPLLVRRLTPHHPDPDIVRWALLGRVPQQWRIAVNRQLLSPTGAALPSDETIMQTSATGNAPPVSGLLSLTAPNVDTPSTVRIVHADGDEDAARHIEDIMEEIDDDLAGNVTYTLLVLSYRTPVDMVRECMHLSANVIGVMVTDIHLPPDIHALADVQLIDARHNNWPQVRAALRYLAHQDEVSRARDSQNILPANLAPTGYVPGVRNLTNHLLGLVGLVLIFVALFFTYMILSSVSIRPVPAVFVPLVIGCVLLLLAAIVLLRCIRNARRGRLWLIVPATWGLVVFPAVIMLIVELTGNLSFDLLDTVEPASQRPLLIVAGLYSLIAMSVIRLLRPKNCLLVASHAGVLGTPSVSPGWMMIYVILCMVVLVTTLAALSLF